MEEVLLSAGNMYMSNINAVCRARGVKLLYSYTLEKSGVHSDICYAEAAFAENIADKIFAGQQCAGSKMIRLVSRGTAVVIAAAGADRTAFKLFHAVHTVILHRYTPYIIINSLLSVSEFFLIIYYQVQIVGFI